VVPTGVSELRAANHTPHHQPVAKEAVGNPHAPAIRVPNAHIVARRYRWAIGGIIRRLGANISTTACWPHRALAAYKRVTFLLIGPFSALHHRHEFPLLGAPANKRPDMREHFVIDPLISKRQQLLLATQLCRMVLKVSAPIPNPPLRTTPPPLSRDVFPSCRPRRRDAEQQM